MTTPAMIVTSDPVIGDDLLRLAAAADTGAEIVQDAGEARADWRRPPLVLVGAESAEEVVAAGLPRRQGVVLVAKEGETDDVYRKALEIGAQDLAVLPDDESWLIDAMAAAAEPAEGRGAIVCVCSSRGGTGASVFAAGLALSAARTGARTLLIDGDPLGGGLEITLGLEDHEGARWPDFADRRGRLNAAALREALPSLGEVSVLSWRRGKPVPVTQEAVQSLLDAAARGFDLIVVDVPRHPGEIGRCALRAAEVTYLLVPAEVRAAVAADVMASTLRRETAALRLIVRNPAPGGLTPEVIAEALGLPLAGVLERDRRLPAALEEGDLARFLRRKGPLAELCGHLLSDLGFYHCEEPVPEAA
ncbi:septum formation initiator [Actinomadura rubrobrunea]|uniref:Septum formation initiator n=1 Tax=Actinomadura rubrobrunea TaxID=115335 RepID=A0A9W6PX65_9ACTN|nr:septum site-determining protein Ssd [Actinomadura rubrobrunea]GLW64523.1 septum formation initiator [Actinomadura rubrobrunea]